MKKNDHVTIIITLTVSFVVENLRSGMESLDKLPLSDIHQGFNLDRAQFLLFLSSIMYERNEKQVIKAYRTLSNMKKDINTASDDDLQEIYKILKESEKGIRNQIKDFDLQFTSLSELNTIEGPYVGIFWSEERNFITIACKGINKFSYIKIIVIIIIYFY